MNILHQNYITTYCIRSLLVRLRICVFLLIGMLLVNNHKLEAQLQSSQITSNIQQFENQHQNNSEKDKMPPSFSMFAADVLWLQGGVQSLLFTSSPYLTQWEKGSSSYHGFTFAIGNINFTSTLNLGWTAGYFLIGNPDLGVFILGSAGGTILSGSGGLINSGTTFGLTAHGGAVFLARPGGGVPTIEIGILQHWYSHNGGVTPLGLRIGASLPIFTF
jgi:hypothetical protein